MSLGYLFINLNPELGNICGLDLIPPSHNSKNPVIAEAVNALTWL